MGIGNYFYNLALNPKTDKGFLSDVLKQTDEAKKIREECRNWLEKISEDVYIESTNNGKLNLHANKLINSKKTNKWVIIIHGYMYNGKGMSVSAKRFFEKGYNILLPDLRGHGESEGDYVGMGWHDRLDILDWINYLVNENQNYNIIIFGVSMGAATTMMTTGEKLPKQVKLAIEDCGYTSAWEQFSYVLKKRFHLPKFPVLYLADRTCKKRANYGIQEVSSIEQVKKSKIPILFIHGDKDSFVPFKMLNELYDSATCPKEKLVIEGAEHAMSESVNPELYWDTIERFIKKYNTNKDYLVS